MSTRYLKKVFGSNVILEKDGDIEEVDEQVGNGRQKLFNVYDLVS